MLIRFTLKNFGSFLQEQSLSMIKGRETQLSDHANKDEAGGFKTLKGAVIYGSNASGKSNLIEAIRYARDFIVHNRKKDKGREFKLSKSSVNEPSSFNFEFKIDGNAYSYGFESKGKEVVSEWLYEISAGGTEKMLFERKPKTGDKAHIEFNKKALEHLTKNKADWTDLESLARTTPDDTLFLYDAKRRNIKLFLTPLKWFEEKLIVLNPDTWLDSIEPFSKQREGFREFVTRMLKAADVGISDVKLLREKDVVKLSIPPKIAEKIDQDLKEGESGLIILDKTRLILTKEGGKLYTDRLVTIHKTAEGDEIQFELDQESDGTRRLIDLAPAFFTADTPDKVLIIDELDRSLHPMITEMLHDAHYNDPVCENGQMIIATHEHYLLSQDFFRRDEIWFVEKDKTGVSKLYSLSEYKIRHDKDIEKDYLLGRYGATPYVRKLYAQTNKQP